MQTLVALDALARLGTVWEAAEELDISRSAVSHRLAMLEEILGFELAARAGTGVILTAQGKRYADEVRKSLALLTNAQEERAHRDIEGVPRVSSTAGFSSMWLCKHIAAFHAEHPNIWLQIVSASELDEVTHPDVDLFIAFGDGKWPKHWVQHLYDVEFAPMCSPALLNVQGGLHQPSDVLRFPLLMRRWDDWKEWLRVCNVDAPKESAGIGFSDMILVQTAAIAGQGIMLGDETTCAGALASGELVSPFSTTINPQRGYYLVRHRHKHASPATLAFIRWLTTLLTRTGRQ
jgi:LysR family transcriptional regulator, glycine cleavage system transcriptional activator